MNYDGCEFENEVIANKKSDKRDLISRLKNIHQVTTIKERCERVKGKLQMSECKIMEAEKSTQGQSENRITESHCHRVATLRSSTSSTKAVQEVLMMKSTFPSKNLREGIRMEDQIIREYIVHMH